MITYEGLTLHEAQRWVTNQRCRVRLRELASFACAHTANNRGTRIQTLACRALHCVHEASALMTDVVFIMLLAATQAAPASYPFLYFPLSKSSTSPWDPSSREHSLTMPPAPPPYLLSSSCLNRNHHQLSTIDSPMALCGGKYCLSQNAPCQSRQPGTFFPGASLYAVSTRPMNLDEIQVQTK